jgi:hypothetical protein
MMDDKFQNDYPIINDLVMELFNRVNELEYQNAQLKYKLERYEKAELANGATRKFVNDNMFVINYMDKYLKDIGAI